jgi:hypothetical protein
MKELCFFTNVSGEQYAPWAQAILSAFAILASALLVHKQHKLELQRTVLSETGRKRQHLESTFQLVGAVYQVTQKLVQWALPGGMRPYDRYDLFKMKLELEGLVEALRQTDYGRFDSHKPIEATLFAISVTRQMLAHLKSVHVLDAPLRTTDVDEIGKMGADLGSPLKERLDELHAMVRLA